MSFVKSALIVAGLSLAFTTGALAQAKDPDINDDGMAYITNPAGKVTKIKKINAKGHAMIVKHGVKLKPGTMIYRKGSDFYMLENKKLDNDMWMHDHAKGWVEGE
jgi:hypothetical protein